MRSRFFVRSRYRALSPLLGISVLALAGCASGSTPAAQPAAPCPAPTVATTGWNTIDEGEFSFRLPEGFERVATQGIDSDVGTFRSESLDAEVSFDWGWYSNALSNDPDVYSSYSRCTETIGGREATIITGVLQTPDADGRYVAAATWRNVVTRDQPVHLTMWATARTDASLDELLAILRTVEFSVR